MRRPRGKGLIVLIAALSLGAGCGGSATETPSVVATPVDVRIARRTFDGAPPVIPHGRIGPFCLQCHGKGMTVPGIGFAPPVPHGRELVNGSLRRCEQCHVYQEDPQSAPIARSGFVPFRHGERPTAPWAPPAIPHPLLLRENCMACHGGPAAHAPRCDHPERVRCTQCHLDGSGPRVGFRR